MKKGRGNIQKWSAAASVKTTYPLGWQSRLCCIILAIFIAVSNLCSPAFAVSDPCKGNHSFKTYYNDYIDDWLQTDYCQKCGKHPRVHLCLYPLRFMTMGTTYSYTDPLESSTSKLLTNSARHNVNVTGRVRNKDGKLWLLLDDGTYISADSVAFNYEYYAEDAVKSVSNLIDKIWGMFFTFNSKIRKTYDMKRDELLGNTYPYKLYLSGEFLPGRYSGEQIGNMMYGYASAAKGFRYDEAVGYAELATEGKDSLKDKFSILLGYTHRKTGAGYGDVSSRYIGKAVAIKSVEVGKYVSSNTNQNVGGINAVANRNLIGAWEMFTVEKGKSGSIGFRAKGNSNYLSARIDEKKESAYIQAAYGQNYPAPQSWESFYILEWGGDQYILSQANWRWVQVSCNESDNPIKACADTPSTWEKFRLETVDSGSAESGSTTSGTNGASMGTPAGGVSSSGNASTVTTVSQRYWGSDYNEGWYEGEWSNGKPNGKGKLTYNDFDDGYYYSIVMYGVEYKALYYEGDFCDGWRYGTGKVVYEGGWIQEGTFYGVWAAGKKIFEGKVWNKNSAYYWEGSQTATSGLGAEWT